jgi:hypothetical protein
VIAAAHASIGTQTMVETMGHSGLTFLVEHGNKRPLGATVEAIPIPNANKKSDQH